jgi:hypothetical protein
MMRCRQNFDGKFFSYWGTVLVLVAGIACCHAGLALFVSATNGWNIGTLVAGGASVIALLVLTIFDAAVPCSRSDERVPVRFAWF